MNDIKESDWKIFRALRTVALQRFCQRVLDELRQKIDSAGTAHQRYLDICESIHNQDEKLAAAFNQMSRSRAITHQAITHLAIMRHEGLLTDEEMAQFSDETRSVIDFLLSREA